MTGLTPDSTTFVWRFGAAELDEAARELRVNGCLVEMEPRPLEVLLHLLRHAGEVVSKQDLLDAVYGHRHLSDGALAQAIRRLRRALLDDGQRIIATIHRVGYKFIADVQRIEAVGQRSVPVLERPATAAAARLRRTIARRFGRPVAWASVLAAAALLLTGSHPSPLSIDRALAWSSVSLSNDAYLHALILLHRRHTTMAEMQETTQSLRLAVTLDPDFASAWALLAQETAHLVFNHHDVEANRIDSKRALTKAQQLRPDSPDTLVAQGYYDYWVDGDYDAAKRVMQHVQSRWPERNEATIALAGIARREGRYAASAEYFQQALTHDRFSVALAVQHAEVRLALQQFDAALKWVNFALDLAPLDVQAIGIKASIYQQLGDLKQAASVLGPLAGQRTDFEATHLLADQARLERDFTSSIGLWRRYLIDPSVRQDSNTPFAEMELGHLLLINGDKAAASRVLQSARQGLERARVNQPSDPRPVGFLALVCADLGENELATTLADSTLSFEVVRRDATRLAFFQAIQAKVAARTRDKDHGFAVLNHMLRASFVFNFAPGLLDVDPEWDDMRADARFTELLRTAAVTRGGLREFDGPRT